MASNFSGDIVDVARIQGDLMNASIAYFLVVAQFHLVVFFKCLSRTPSVFPN